jgi:dolichol-phosphate mannosyltransferase
MQPASHERPQLSVVVPVVNEAESIGALIDETLDLLRGQIDFELLIVDDASTDDSSIRVAQAMRHAPELRLLRHRKQSGQSTAIRSGVRAAAASWVATLDGDGQNDPADLLRLWVERGTAAPEVKLFAGWRVTRRDPWSKRFASRVANRIRAALLRDATPDTGCGTKLFEREAFLDLPYFDHMHRYLPALFQRAGWRTVSVAVNHRERLRGCSNYSNWRRAWVGLWDLLGVAWLITRSRVVGVDEEPRR